MVLSYDDEPCQAETSGSQDDGRRGHRHQVRGCLYRRLYPLPLGHRAQDLLPPLGYVRYQAACCEREQVKLLHFTMKLITVLFELW